MIDYVRILQWLDNSYEYWVDRDDAEYFASQLTLIAKAAGLTKTYCVKETAGKFFVGEST